MTQHSAEAGFSLLEAVVAMALLAAVLVPLYALIGQSLRGTDRSVDSNRTSEIRMNALQTMNAVNPMIQPEGAIDLGVYRIHWTSRPAEPPRAGRDVYGDALPFMIGLYDCAVTVIAPDNQALLSFPLRRVGYRRVDGVE